MTDPIHHKKKLALVLLLITAIAGAFWLGSRYPALNEKALMGGDTSMEGLGFDVLITIANDDPLPLKIIYHTVNWMETNKRGMIFGFLLAAGLILLFTLLQDRQFNSRWLNSVLGVFIGAPLGVCVNCAAPLAQGIRKAGGKEETALSMMISSPTLNIIVLTMLFTLLPFYMAMIKIMLTAVFLLLVIPVLVSLVPSKSIAPAGEMNTAWNTWQILDISLLPGSESWRDSLKWVGINYGKSLWYILKSTLPLMLLAGLAGNILITLLPWDVLTGLIPKAGFPGVLIIFGVLALLGLILPVPMSFDVIICVVLLVGGMPPKYVMVLLFTLGIFSIYSFLIVRQSMSFKLALGLMACLVLLGIGSGVAAHYFAIKENKKLEAVFGEFLEKQEGLSVLFEKTYPSNKKAAEVSGGAVGFQQIDLALPPGISMHKADFKSPVSASDTLFTQLSGPSLGIGLAYSFSLINLLEPYALGRGISSGDINRDHWQDFVIADYQGLSIFMNTGDGRFYKREIDLPQFDSVYVFNAALVDMDNDSWLDLLITTYLHGNYILYNDSGKFGSLHRLPLDQDTRLTAAVSAGDPDKDGDLDLAMANWTLGPSLLVFPRKPFRPSPASGDDLLINNNGEFRQKKLPGLPGESLCALISDFNNDNLPDLIVGNDHFYPDHYYRGNGQGQMTLLTRSDSIIPLGTKFTMSVTTADIDNNGQLEIYQTQDSELQLNRDYWALNVKGICGDITDPAEKKDCEQVYTIQQTIVSMKTSAIDRVRYCEESYRADCIGYKLWNMALTARTNNDQRAVAEKICRYFPPSWESYNLACLEEVKLLEYPEIQYQQAIPQSAHQNVLLMPQPNGRFRNMALARGLETTGWSWNGKFADLDQDEWVDLYVVNGFMWKKRQSTNLLLMNDQGQQFLNRTDESNMRMGIPCQAYTYMDMDNDGDMDIFVVPSVGPVIVYRNNATLRAIRFMLRDEIGNYYGINSKIYIYYGDGKQQMREMVMGGGFRSFDPYEAHFGLGSHQQVDKVVIQWSTGERTTIDGPLAAGARYWITRHRSSTTMNP